MSCLFTHTDKADVKLGKLHDAKNTENHGNYLYFKAVVNKQ